MRAKKVHRLRRKDWPHPGRKNGGDYMVPSKEQASWNDICAKKPQRQRPA